MKSLLLAAIFVLLCPALLAQGGGGQSQSQSAAGSSGALLPAGQIVQMSPGCTSQTNNCFPVRGTGAFDCGVSWATASPHAITLSSFATRQFSQADVGTIAWGATASCGAVTESSGSVVLGLAQTTIASVIDATHATVTGSFLANCTTGGEGNCIFVWGDVDETTQVNAAFAAITTNSDPTPCGTLDFSGIIFVSLPIINTTGNCLGPGNAGQLTRYSYAVVGSGENASVIVPIPSFNGATCPSGAGMIFGQTNGGGAQGVYFRDFQVNAFGGTIANAPGTGCKVIAVGADGLAQHVSIMNEGINEANVTGFSITGIAGEPSFSIHVEVVSSGAVSCALSANTQNIFPYCVGGSLPFAFNGVGPVYTYQANGGFVGAGTAVASCISSGLTWYSDHDQFYFEHAGQKIINTVSGCTLYLNDDQILSNSASATALNIVSGAIAHIHDSIVTATGTTSTGIANAGTVFNEGGNTISGTTAGYSGAGVATAVTTEAGTVSCTTSAATISFAGTYVNSPNVVIQDQTTAGAVTQTSLSKTSKVVGCPGASDVLNYSVTPAPF